jgi:hypothetical protein
MLNTFDTRPPAVVTERHRTGPDALTFTSAPIAKPDWRPGYSGTTLGHTHDRELYKVRNSPHLYEQWHVDLVEDQRAAYLDTLPDDVEDWDCHHCKAAVITAENARCCPTCGRG